MNKKKSRIREKILSSDTGNEEIEKSPTHDNGEFSDVLSPKKTKFTCSICKKFYSDKNCLKKHVRKVHEIEPATILPQSTYTLFLYDRMRIISTPSVPNVEIVGFL
jgi:hypothetical protein